jgi:uncharacterized protein YhfF
VSDKQALCAEFWQDFRSTDEEGRLPVRAFDICQIGDDRAAGDHGATLVLSGVKTATSALPEEFADVLPFEGALTILTDGSGAPVAVFRTTRVRIMPFSAVDAQFARDYGEWDHTLETWRRECGAYYRTVCLQRGLDWHEDRDLVCENFRVVYAGRRSSGIATGEIRLN